jgi:hypothetical protein
MDTLTFEAELQKPPDVQVTYIVVPFSVQAVFGTKGQVKVKGTLDGAEYRSSIQPLGDATHSLIVTKTLLNAIGKTPGDRVTVTMAADTEARTVVVPDDLGQALAANPQAQAMFEKFAYSQRKGYVQWIESAKRPETRVDRVRRAVADIAQGIKRS